MRACTRVFLTHARLFSFSVSFSSFSISFSPAPPQCFAYLDMLEVGNPPGGTGESPLFENVHSWRAHFGAWAITSSPLILSFDLSNATKLNAVWDFITNIEALRVNREWAGVAGKLVKSEYDQSAATAVFARPCSSGVDTQRFELHEEDGTLRSAAANEGFRCLSTPRRTSSTNSQSMPLAPTGVTLGSGRIALAKCNSTSTSQRWNLTGSMGAFSPTVATSIESVKDKGCWEINSCSGSTVDTNYGCKKLPANGTLPCQGCCNMAWRFSEFPLRNGTIVSGMAGADGKLSQCIQVDAKDMSSVVLGTCTGGLHERWVARANGDGTSFAIQPVGDPSACIDNHATEPLYPQYGPLVLANCSSLESPDGSAEKWTLDSATKQLVSSTPGAGGGRICAEVGAYFNHYSPLSAVACAEPNNEYTTAGVVTAIPKAQQWSVDKGHKRVSVDVRFDASQQRSPGMLLCVDIDVGADGGGGTGPGKRLLAQIWSKPLQDGDVAVLFLNADTRSPR